MVGRNFHVDILLNASLYGLWLCVFEREKIVSRYALNVLESLRKRKKAFLNNVHI